MHPRGAVYTLNNKLNTSVVPFSILSTSQLFCFQCQFKLTEKVESDLTRSTEGNIFDYHLNFNLEISVIVLLLAKRGCKIANLPK